MTEAPQTTAPSVRRIASTDAVPTDLLPVDRIIQGDCLDVMRSWPSASVDFVLTDPPYLVRFRDRSGRRIANDDRAEWVKPAFAEVSRVMKPGTLCASFYAWNRVDRFVDAWKEAGLRIIGHVIFRKRYPSSTRFFRYQHEQAYLLAKGNPTRPTAPISDVIDWRYTGNRLHPTQKPVESLKPLIDAFCPRAAASCSTPSAGPARRSWPPASSVGTSSASSLTPITTARPRNA